MENWQVFALKVQHITSPGQRPWENGKLVGFRTESATYHQPGATSLGMEDGKWKLEIGKYKTVRRRCAFRHIIFIENELMPESMCH
jgi:hypothetical protein